ncbi:MAG: hypothetical protein Q9226_005985 [Calogaya cf. arnoldii]
MSIVQRSVDLNGNPGVAQLVVAIIFGILATLSVVLRFLSRRLARVSLSMNDYAVVVALGATLTLAIANVVAQSMTKISILVFYNRLFPTKKFLFASYSLIVVVSVWMFQQVLATLLLCRPISFNWDASVKGTTDILILILPMPIIWCLHVPLRNKLILSLIFGFGSLICILSIIRLKALFLWTTAPMMAPPFNSDGSLNNSLPVLYTVLEVCLGVICACLVIVTNTEFFNSLSRKPSSWTSSSNGDSVAKGRGVSWEAGAKQQRVGARDLRIMKTCDIDVELGPAMVKEERRRPRTDDTHIDGGKEGAPVVEERSTSESSISTSPRDRGSEMEIPQDV